MDRLKAGFMLMYFVQCIKKHWIKTFFLTLAAEPGEEIFILTLEEKRGSEMIGAGKISLRMGSKADHYRYLVYREGRFCTFKTYKELISVLSNYSKFEDVLDTLGFENPANPDSPAKVRILELSPEDISHIASSGIEFKDAVRCSIAAPPVRRWQSLNWNEEFYRWRDDEDSTVVIFRKTQIVMLTKTPRGKTYQSTYHIRSLAHLEKIIKTKASILEVYSSMYRMLQPCPLKTFEDAIKYSV